MSSSQTSQFDGNPTAIRETSTHKNVGPVPEQDPLIHRGVNSEDVHTTQPTTESKGLVSSVVDAARSAAYRAKEVLIGDDTNRTAESDQQRIVSDNRTTSYTDRDREDISGRATTDKMKDAAYDVKEKVKDVAYDAKEKIKDTAHDIRNTSKDTGYDIKNQTKDTAHDIKNQTKDTAHDIKNKTKDTAHDIKNTSKDVAYEDRTADTGHDYSSDRTRDTTLSSDTHVAADSNKQRLRDIKEKVIDSVNAPIEMAQTMWAAGVDRVKEALTPSDTTATSTEPGVSDMFSQDYQPGPAQYQAEPSKTDQAKSKLASTAADAAGKAENLIAQGQQKMNEQADKAQYSAEDARLKADRKAQELANDTRYYSGSDQLY
jgi:gas vesicle protein